MEHKCEYELIYRDGTGAELKYTFPDDVDIHELKNRLEYFLLGCSWGPEVLNKMFRDGLGNDRVYTLNTGEEDE